ncbi:MAG: hypothetical protein NTY38_14375 [Acidobacteria bacterium]|nr:hypothetical protein [Acidobacteriota bacterium]
MVVRGPMPTLVRFFLLSSLFLPPAMAADTVLTISTQWDRPVLGRGAPGTEGNRYGFEGGCVLKLQGVYHLFTSEMTGNPRWVKMKLGHWTSRDRMNWTRRGTMYESSGERTGLDPRAALWAPMPVFDENAQRWNLFYVSYRAPLGPEGWHGRIWRAVSGTPGRKGIDGPWKDVGVILEPGAESGAWEGNQGTDSIFPFPASGRWLGFYGSSNATDYWSVGLAAAPALAGPWKRLGALNPVPLNGALGTENPVVTRWHGKYLAVFDTILREDAIGYAESADGVHWSAARQLMLRRTAELWVRDVRTPLGLVAEGNGTFSLFYTGYDEPKNQGFGCLGLVEVKIGGSAPRRF